MPSLLSPSALMERLRLNPGTDFSVLVGPARTTGRVIERRIDEALASGDAPSMCHVFYGPPGCGKSLLAGIAALRLAGHKLAVEDVSGLDVTIDTVRAWQQESNLGSLFGNVQVKIIQELDRVPPAAQDRMLQYLDKLPPGRAVFATSNLQINLLQSRLESRAQTWKITGPTEDEIRDYIAERWEIGAYQLSQITVGCGGNFRAALLDTQSVLDSQFLAVAA